MLEVIYQRHIEFAAGSSHCVAAVASLIIEKIGRHLHRGNVPRALSAKKKEHQENEKRGDEMRRGTCVCVEYLRRATDGRISTNGYQTNRTICCRGECADPAPRSPGPSAQLEVQIGVVLVAIMVRCHRLCEETLMFGTSESSL